MWSKFSNSLLTHLHNTSKEKRKNYSLPSLYTSSPFEKMSSRRKKSGKSGRDCFVANGSSSQFNDAVPKVEFEIPSVDPEDAAAYWEACGGLKPARAGLWTPPPFIPNHEADCQARAVPMVLLPSAFLKSSEVGSLSSP